MHHAFFYMTKMSESNLPNDAVEVGRIAGAWGVKGAVRILPYSAEADVLFSVDQWYFLPPEPRFAKTAKTVKTAESLSGRGRQARSLAGQKTEQWPGMLTVQQIREQGDSIIALLQEIPDRNTAELFKGGRIFVRRCDFPELEEGEFYWVDLIGLQVVNQQGTVLGQVADLMSNGVQSILRIAYEQADVQGVPRQAERLIPFVDAYVGDVDLQSGVIHVDWEADD